VDPEEQPEENNKEDVWIKAHPGMGTKQVDTVETTGRRVEVHQVGFWRRMKEFLGTLKQPMECTDKEFQKIRRRSPNYFIEEDQLKKRNSPYSQILVSKTAEQNRIMKSLHEELQATIVSLLLCKRQANIVTKVTKDRTRYR
jgi:hypothetical protein